MIAQLIETFSGRNARVSNADANCDLRCEFPRPKNREIFVKTPTGSLAALTLMQQNKCPLDCTREHSRAVLSGISLKCTPTYFLSRIIRISYECSDGTRKFPSRRERLFCERDRCASPTFS